MGKTEAPLFIHSEAERAEMLVKMQAIAKKAAISAEELEDVCWLVLDRDTVEGEEMDDDFSGEMVIPNYVNPKIVLASATKGRFLDMILADGISSIPAFTGEYFRMDTDENGERRWRIGIESTAYSDFLNRRVEFENKLVGLMMAKDPLRDVEHALLASRLVDVYQESLPCYNLLLEI